MNSPMPRIAARMLGADEVRVFYDQVFVKEPQTVEMTDWHQDLPFWPMRGGDIISIWVALTPVSHENSAVEYIAGSHKWGKFYAAVTPDKDAKFYQTPALPQSGIKGLRLSPVPMKLGEATPQDKDGKRIVNVS